jgi:hypothetical protein
MSATSVCDQCGQSYPSDTRVTPTSRTTANSSWCVVTAIEKGEAPLTAKVVKLRRPRGRR